jgi:hypothetical protein
MATYGDAIAGGRVHVNDAVPAYRNTDATLLAFVKDGIREMISTCKRYDLFMAPLLFTCTQGGTDFQLPNPARQLYIIDFYEVENAGVRSTLEECPLETLRRHRTTWRTDTPGPAENWARYPKEPGKRDDTRFILYPPALPGQILIGNCAQVPDQSAVSAGSDLPVTDEYLPALSAYVGYRCEGIDDENVLSQRAASLYQMFMGIVVSDAVAKASGA